MANQQTEASWNPVFRLDKSIADLFGITREQYLLESYNIYTGAKLSEAAQKVARFADRRVFRYLDPDAENYTKINRARLKYSQFAMVYGTSPSELSFVGPVNYYYLIIPIRGMQVYISETQKFKFKPGQALLSPLDQKYRIQRSKNHVVLVCSLSKSGYELIAHKNTMISLFQAGCLTSLLDMREEKFKTMLGLLSALVNTLNQKDQNQLSLEEMLALIEQAFWMSLINALPELKTDTGLSTVGISMPGFLRRTLSYINKNCEEEISLATMAKVAGKSKRTLQLIFHKTFGLGPTAYVKKIKLMRVREEILKHSSHDIQTIAARFGFYHPGNFARYYRQEFNELPSETVRKLL